MKEKKASLFNFRHILLLKHRDRSLLKIFTFAYLISMHRLAGKQEPVTPVFFLFINYILLSLYPTIYLGASKHRLAGKHGDPATPGSGCCCTVRTKTGKHIKYTCRQIRHVDGMIIIVEKLCTNKFNQKFCILYFKICLIFWYIIKNKMTRKGIEITLHNDR